MKLNYQSLPSLQSIPKDERWKTYKDAYNALRSDSEPFRKNVKGYKVQIGFLVLLLILSGLSTAFFQPSEKMIIGSIAVSLAITIIIVLKAIEMQRSQNAYIDRFLSKQK